MQKIRTDSLMQVNPLKRDPKGTLKDKLLLLFFVVTFFFQSKYHGPVSCLACSSDQRCSSCKFTCKCGKQFFKRDSYRSHLRTKDKKEEKAS